MYYNLVGALRRRLILELQDSFSRHPIYSKIVPSIQGKFAFEGRPHFGIVVKGMGANKVALSGDNFIGEVHSHVMLAYVDQPVFPLEWVREDLSTVARNGGMPSLAGVYFLEVLSAPTLPEEIGYFAIDPLYTISDQLVTVFQSGVETEGQLTDIPAQNTLRLYENGRILLREGTDYTVNYSTGAITFSRAFSPQSRIYADYRSPGTSMGPFEFTWNSSNHTAIPGVVLAFGKRSEAGQKVAVVVYPNRVQTAQAYGGKTEVTFDLEVLTTDTTQLEEITDLVYMYLWNNKKSALEFEGIEILDVSVGGESEEPLDETGQGFKYSANVAVSLRADWEAHVPLPLTISRMEMTETSGLNNGGPLFYETYPIIAGRNADFERIT